MHISPIPLAALMPVIIVALLFVGFCWYDILHSEQVRYAPKWVWMLICLLSVPLGGIVYFFVGKRQ